MARVHRIGQKRTVHIYRLVSAGTYIHTYIHRICAVFLLPLYIHTYDRIRGAEDRSESSEETISGFHGE